MFDAHHEVLRPSERERGTMIFFYALSALCDELLRFLGQGFPGLLSLKSIAVGGFDDQRITTQRRRRVAEDGHVGSVPNRLENSTVVLLPRAGI